MVEYLENNNYDGEEFMRICKKQNHIRGIAYLNYKTNRIKEARLIYQSFIAEEWQNVQPDFTMIGELIDDLLRF